MHTLQVIVGSTRPTRAADQVARWVMDRAGRHEAIEPELLDLRDDLAWWSTVLGQARATGELPPAVLRMRAAMTAA